MGMLDDEGGGRAMVGRDEVLKEQLRLRLVGHCDLQKHGHQAKSKDQ